MATGNGNVKNQKKKYNKARENICSGHWEMLRNKNCIFMLMFEFRMQMKNEQCQPKNNSRTSFAIVISTI